MSAFHPLRPLALLLASAASGGLASQLGATGTPLFVVGDKVINAAVGYEELKKAVASARKG